MNRKLDRLRDEIDDGLVSLSPDSLDTVARTLAAHNIIKRDRFYEREEAAVIHVLQGMARIATHSCVNIAHTEADTKVAYIPYGALHYRSLPKMLRTVGIAVSDSIDVFDPNDEVMQSPDVEYFYATNELLEAEALQYVQSVLMTQQNITPSQQRH